MVPGGAKGIFLFQCNTTSQLYLDGLPDFWRVQTSRIAFSFYFLSFSEGSIPAELGRLKALKTLDLDGNQFTGERESYTRAAIHAVTHVHTHRPSCFSCHIHLGYATNHYGGAFNGGVRFVLQNNIDFDANRLYALDHKKRAD